MFSRQRNNGQSRGTAWLAALRVSNGALLCGVADADVYDRTSAGRFKGACSRSWSGFHFREGGDGFDVNRDRSSFDGVWLAFVVGLRKGEI